MEPKSLQIHVALPYKRQPRDDERIAGLLARGYRITNLLRITDQEAVVNLEWSETPTPSASGA